MSLLQQAPSIILLFQSLIDPLVLTHQPYN